MEVVGNEAQRDKHEKDVRPRPKEEKLEGLDPPGLVIGYGEDFGEALPVRGCGFVAVGTNTVLQEGRPVGRRHLEECKIGLRRWFNGEGERWGGSVGCRGLIKV